MLRDLDPRMDDVTRQRLTRLIDVMEVGPAPTAAELAAAPVTGIRDLRPTDERAERGPDRRWLLVAALAAVVLLVVGVVAVLAGSGDDDAGPVANDPDAIPRLALDPATVPSDLPARYGTDLPIPEAELDGSTGSVTLYGFGEPGADPFAPGDLAVIVSNFGGIGLEGDPRNVRGHEGASGGPAGLGGGMSIDTGDAGDDFAWVTWYETDEVDVTLASRSLDVDTLATVAESLDVSGTNVTLGVLPDGVGSTEIGRLENVPFESVYVPASAAGHGASYGQVGGTFLLVETWVADHSDLSVARWMADARQPVEVRGQEGWSSSTRTQTGPVDTTVETLVWEEGDGVAAVVQASGLRADQVLGLADGMVDATDAQWQVMLDAAAAVEASDDAFNAERGDENG